MHQVGGRKKTKRTDDKDAEEELEEEEEKEEEEEEEEEDSLSQSGLNLGESTQADLLEGSEEA